MSPDNRTEYIIKLLGGTKYYVQIRWVDFSRTIWSRHEQVARINRRSRVVLEYHLGNPRDEDELDVSQITLVDGLRKILEKKRESYGMDPPRKTVLSRLRRYATLCDKLIAGIEGIEIR